MKNVRFLRFAESEMIDAARYYELLAPGLGNDFLDKIESASLIVKSPVFNAIPAFFNSVKLHFG